MPSRGDRMVLMSMKTIEVVEKVTEKNTKKVRDDEMDKNVQKEDIVLDVDKTKNEGVAIKVRT